ncbi:MAG: hypothetical protein LBV51_05695 [Acholeplasmatales bacterium]|jgi:multiple sugar transport system substrate-binding protein|nr:hypothetical protein [Acholeplasmatales bacterium]
MKKILTILLLCLSSIILISCKSHTEDPSIAIITNITNNLRPGIENLEKVTSGFQLYPSVEGVSISYESNDTAHLILDTSNLPFVILAKIVRPLENENDAHVVLTATLSIKHVKDDNVETRTKSFDLTILAITALTEEDKVEDAYNSITLPNPVTSNFPLVLLSSHGVNISYASSNSSYISIDGDMAIVTRPNNGYGAVNVSITVTFVLGQSVRTKIIVVTVAEKQEVELTPEQKINNAYDILTLPVNIDHLFVLESFNMPNIVGEGVNVSYLSTMSNVVNPVKNGNITNVIINRQLENKIVTLIATLEIEGAYSIQKVFELKVIGTELSPELKVQMVYETLVLPLANYIAVTTNFNVPSLVEDCLITWTSSNYQVVNVSDSGTPIIKNMIITKPSVDTEIILTAVISFEGVSLTKVFNITVLAIDLSKSYSIEFYGWGDAAEMENYTTLINQFMHDFPNIIVSYQADNASTYPTALRNRANNLPDIFYMPDTEFMAWASEEDKLLDITSYFRANELDLLWEEAVNKYYYNRTTGLAGKENNGRLYGIPKDLGPFTLVYNKTLLNQLAQANNVSAEEVSLYTNPSRPMSWDEFVSFLHKLDVNPTDDIYGITHYEIEAAVYSNNADFFNQDQSVQTITNPNFVQALQWIADLSLVEHLMPSADDQISTNGYQRFFTGKSVFSFMGPWDNIAFWQSTSFDFDVLPVPYGKADNAKSTAWVGSMSYSMSKKTKSPEAAVLLAKYLCYNEQAQRKFYDLGQQVPNIKSMANDEYINNPQFTNAGLPSNVSVARKGFPNNRQVFVDIINGFRDENDLIGGKARATYYTYNSLWKTDFLDSLVAMWHGNESAYDAMQRLAPILQAQLNEMINDYRS